MPIFARFCPFIGCMPLIFSILYVVCDASSVSGAWRWV